jgi:hypothetical protein
MNSPSYLRKGAISFLGLMVAGLIAELATGFFSGVGLDVRQIGHKIGGTLKPVPIETGAIVRPPPKPAGDDKETRAKCVRERLAQLSEENKGVRAAEAELNRCLADAKWSLFKMWNPEAHCEVYARVKMALEAGREVTKRFGC